MRSRDEIQRAHDLLEPIVTGEVPWPHPAGRETLAPVLGVLCWVLEDANARDFECFFNIVEKRLAALGYQLGSPLPFHMKGRHNG